jgi:hypothetical protein
MALAMADFGGGGLGPRDATGKEFMPGTPGRILISTMAGLAGQERERAATERKTSLPPLAQQLAKLTEGVRVAGKRLGKG